MVELSDLSDDSSDFRTSASGVQPSASTAAGAESALGLQANPTRVESTDIDRTVLTAAANVSVTAAAPQKKRIVSTDIDDVGDTNMSSQTSDVIPAERSSSRPLPPSKEKRPGYVRQNFVKAQPSSRWTASSANSSNSMTNRSSVKFTESCPVNHLARPSSSGPGSPNFRPRATWSPDLPHNMKMHGKALHNIKESQSSTGNSSTKFANPKATLNNSNSKAVVRSKTTSVTPSLRPKSLSKSKSASLASPRSPSQGRQYGFPGGKKGGGRGSRNFDGADGGGESRPQSQTATLTTGLRGSPPLAPPKFPHSISARGNFGGASGGGNEPTITTTNTLMGAMLSNTANSIIEVTTGSFRAISETVGPALDCNRTRDGSSENIVMSLPSDGKPRESTHDEDLEANLTRQLNELLGDVELGSLVAPGDDESSEKVVDDIKFSAKEVQDNIDHNLSLPREVQGPQESLLIENDDKKNFEQPVKSTTFKVPEENMSTSSEFTRPVSQFDLKDGKFPNESALARFNAYISGGDSEMPVAAEKTAKFISDSVQPGSVDSPTIIPGERPTKETEPEVAETPSDSKRNDAVNDNLNPETTTTITKNLKSKKKDVFGPESHYMSDANLLVGNLAKLNNNMAEPDSVNVKETPDTANPNNLENNQLESQINLLDQLPSSPQLREQLIREEVRLASALDKFRRFQKDQREAHFLGEAMSKISYRKGGSSESNFSQPEIVNSQGSALPAPKLSQTPVPKTMSPAAQRALEKFSASTEISENLDPDIQRWRARKAVEARLNSLTPVDYEIINRLTLSNSKSNSKDTVASPADSIGYLTYKLLDEDREVWGDEDGRKQLNESRKKAYRGELIEIVREYQAERLASNLAEIRAALDTTNLIKDSDDLNVNSADKEEPSSSSKYRSISVSHLTRLVTSQAQCIDPESTGSNSRHRSLMIASCANNYQPETVVERLEARKKFSRESTTTSRSVSLRPGQEPTLSLDELYEQRRLLENIMSWVQNENYIGGPPSRNSGTNASINNEFSVNESDDGSDQRRQPQYIARLMKNYGSDRDRSSSRTVTNPGQQLRGRSPGIRPSTNNYSSESEEGKLARNNRKQKRVDEYYRSRSSSTENQALTRGGVKAKLKNGLINRSSSENSESDLREDYY